MACALCNSTDVPWMKLSSTKHHNWPEIIQKYGEIEVDKRGHLCRKCASHLKALHEKATQFYNLCQKARLNQFNVPGAASFGPPPDMIPYQQIAPRRGLQHQQVSCNRTSADLAKPPVKRIKIEHGDHNYHSSLSAPTAVTTQTSKTPLADSAPVTGNTVAVRPSNTTTDSNTTMCDAGALVSSNPTPITSIHVGNDKQSPLVARVLVSKPNPNNSVADNKRVPLVARVVGVAKLDATKEEIENAKTGITDAHTSVTSAIDRFRVAELMPTGTIDTVSELKPIQSTRTLLAKPESIVSSTKTANVYVVSKPDSSVSAAETTSTSVVSMPNPIVSATQTCTNTSLVSKSNSTASTTQTTNTPVVSRTNPMILATQATGTSVVSHSQPNPMVTGNKTTKTNVVPKPTGIASGTATTNTPVVSKSNPMILATLTTNGNASVISKPLYTTAHVLIQPKPNNPTNIINTPIAPLVARAKALANDRAPPQITVKEYQKVLSTLQTGDADLVADVLLKSSTLRQSITRKLVKEAVNNTEKLGARKSLLTNTLRSRERDFAAAIKDFSWASIVDENLPILPTLIDLMLAVSLGQDGMADQKKVETMTPKIGFILAILLQSRHADLGFAQHMVTFILCLAKKKVLYKRLQRLGICLSFVSMCKLRKEELTTPVDSLTW